MDESPSVLAPALLIAMPQLRDPNFARTVVLLCEHGPAGAMGFVVNRPTETLAAEASVKTKVLFTIEGLTKEEASAGEDYLSLMREDLDALRAALRCS